MSGFEAFAGRNCNAGDSDPEHQPLQYQVLQSGGALLFALIIAALLSLIVQSDLQSLLGDQRIAATAVQRIELEKTARTVLQRERSRLLTLIQDGGCPLFSCFSSLCRDGMCHFGAIDDAGVCRLSAAAQPPWQNPAYWSAERALTAANGRKFTLQLLNEFRCSVTNFQTGLRAGLLRTTVRLTDSAGGIIVLQSLYSHWGQHRWVELTAEREW